MMKLAFPIHLLSALFVASSAFAAAPRTGDFAQGVVLEAATDQPLIELTLPDAVYEKTTSTALADIRVFNAEGVAVPHALCPPQKAMAAVVTGQTLPIYELQEARRQAGEGTRIEVQTAEGTQVRVQEGDQDVQAAAASIRAHVIDARAVTGMLQSIQFEWRSPDGASEVSVRIEASDDLDRWATIVAQSVLLSAQRGDIRLQRQRIELPQRQYRYLRVERADGGPALAISSVTAEVISEAVGTEPIWFAASIVPAGQNDTLSFLSTRLAPIEYARLRMPVENSSLQVTVQSRHDEKAPWLNRWSGETYLFVNEGERRESAPASFSATHDRYWRVTLPKNTDPSSVPPLLELGYYPAKLRFLAQGARPYILAFGSRRAEPAPATNCDGLLANVSRQEREQLMGMGYPGVQRTLGGDAALQPLPKKTPTRLIVLWGVLISGVGLLVAMALSLLKRLRPTGTDG